MQNRSIFFSNVNVDCSLSGKGLDIYLWMTAELKFAKSDKGLSFSDNTLIVGAAHSDFDGDGCPDILLLTKNETKQKKLDIFVYWNVDQRLSINQRTYVGMMNDQPLIIDANGDLLPDLIGVNSANGELTTWLSKSGVPGAQFRRTFEAKSNDNTTKLAAFPVTSAFVDLNRDFHSDLFLPVMRDSKMVLQIWQTKDGLFKDKGSMMEIQLPNELKNMRFGQPSFADIDADGHIDLILPLCDLNKCELPAIYAYSKNTWIKLLGTTVAAQTTWRFPVGDFDISALLNFPPVLRIGDFTMDGYPDAVAVFEGKHMKRVAYLLENVPCASKPETMCNGQRAFHLKTKIPLERDPALIALFDLYENGILDFLVVTTVPSGKFTVRAYRNDFNTDTTFLKITVLSGRCYKKCVCKKIETPYGANQVGAVAAYKTTSPEGKVQHCAAVQLSQSAHFSLQLPYTLFGLGRSPNFVDKVEVGIPQGNGKVDRKHSWPSLIPNSQVIVIPFPPDKPWEWMTKLLVTPSKLLLQTGGVLIGTCVFVAGLILMLYIKEKREDEKEKRQEAHKFHFDAL
eukprot:Seg2680.1 transcript_id=Seg2680.1/GoldUCD/mRNA.D3Y31 product="T-cell immunomodulatory protein" protein_id=Seg2680.1/GoldUCD/D3Y31